jgi:23S rRNA (cytosine1962-C5)-methyltransferase
LSTDAVVTLKATREKSLLRHHPWVYAGAIDRVDGSPRSGETVEVRAQNGAWLGRGAYSPSSQIAIRIWSFSPEQQVCGEFLRARLQTALDGRRLLLAELETPALRLVNAESDGLPGVVVDRYGDYLVCQFTAAGAEHCKPEIVKQLRALLTCTGIYERSDVDVREKEGLPLCAGPLWGETPPPLLEIRERRCRFWVDIQHGHKTGFYLDQRDSRQALAQHCAGAEVLDTFAYSGTFGVAALVAGAVRVTAVDSSAEALQLATRNAELNGIAGDALECVQADAFQELRRFRDSGRAFDVIVLDPPKFAAARSQLPGAARGYKDINLLAFKLLRRDGILATFSCSGLMPTELFQKIVADAALDAGREVQILRHLTQAPDHPVALNFPEGSYLKGLLCRVW